MPTNISGTTGIDKVQDGTIVDADIDTVAASKLTGALPAISAANLTSIPAANITGTLPAIDGSSLTGIAGRKNLIINGGFDVWQRGTTGTAQGYNSADRWYIARGGGSPAVSITRETFATTETDIKSKYYLQWVQSTGGTNPYIVQKVEEVKPFLGQEVTVSVWMKAASAVTIDLDVYIDYGDAQSTTLDENTSFSVTTSWQKFQHTFTISSGGTVAANNNLEVRFSPPDSNTITTYFAEAQLEFGDTATDFEHRSYGEELALCQRYFERIAGAVNVAYSSGSATYANQPRTILFYKTQKRAVPTLSSSTASEFRFQFSNSVNTPSAISLASIGVDTAFLNASGITISADTPCTLVSNSSSSYLDFSSEL